MNKELLGRRSGWRVRLLTRNGAQQGPTGEEIRKAWGFDPKTTIVIGDPTSPNILQFKVRKILWQVVIFILDTPNESVQPIGVTLPK